MTNYYLLALLCLLFSCCSPIEKRLVVVVLSYNNSQWYKANLDSIFQQSYNNYIVLYIDDASPDGTADLVEDYIQEHQVQDKIILVRNKKRVGVMANHYRAVHLWCDDDDIVVHVDGDDFLYNNTVFAKVNELYQDDDIWLTTGRPLMSSSGEQWPALPQEVMQYVKTHNTFRNGWPLTHLRTFRAWLFKLVHLKDLMLKSSFKEVECAADSIFMPPLCELAGFHGTVLDDLLYVYNEKNPLSLSRSNTFEQEHAVVAAMRSWPRYQPLAKPIKNRLIAYEQSKADIIVCLENLQTIDTILKSIKDNIGNIDRITIISHDISSYYKSRYPKVSFVTYCKTDPHSFKKILIRSLEKAQEHVILCSHETISEHIDVRDCIKELERTGAHCFYLHKSDIIAMLGEQYAPLWNNIIAWQPHYIPHQIQLDQSRGMVLYRKKDLLSALSPLSFSTIDECKKLLVSPIGDTRAVCLLWHHT